MFSDEKKRKIQKDYIRLKSYKKCALENNMSVYMVKKALGKFDKKEENVVQSENQDIDEYMEKKRKDALDFIGKCLSTMASDEKLTNAPINQIASAMGVVMDKFTKKEKESTGMLDDILRAVKDIE